MIIYKGRIDKDSTFFCFDLNDSLKISKFFAVFSSFIGKILGAADNLTVFLLLDIFFGE
jgi:hypothetical protein